MFSLLTRLKTVRKKASINGRKNFQNCSPVNGFSAPWPGVKVGVVLGGIQQQHHEHLVDPLVQLLLQGLAT